MATGGGETLSDELITLKCNVCAMQNKTRDAEKYCTECQEYYCIPCSDMHKMFAMFKGHNLLTKEDFDGTVHQGSLPHIPTERCTKHAFKVVDMYCEDHDATICASCIVDHRLCSNICSITNDLDKLYQQEMFDEIKSTLKALTKEIEDLAAAKLAKPKELQECRDKAIKEVKTFRKEIDILLDNLEKNSIEEIESRFKAMEAEVTSHISETENLVKSMREASVKLQSSIGNKAQEFVAIKSVKKDIDKSRIKSQSILKDKEKTIEFEANPEIKQLFKRIKSMGTLAERKTSLYKVKRTFQTSVKLRVDINICGILGACMADDGYLLLADYQNNKLKRLNVSSEAIKDFIDLSDPRDVCIISSTEAAVCLCNHNNPGSVQFVTLGNQMSTSRRFNLKHSCPGVAYHDGKLFIVDGRTSVYSYDLFGKALFRTQTDTLGAAIFSSNRKICVSTITNKAYLTDYNKGVVIIDTQGNYLSTLTDLGLMKPTAVCTDGRNIFVAGDISNCVVQIESNEKKIGEFGDISKPDALCFDFKNKKMIVCKDVNDYIQILELE